jgi:tRNA(Ile)-lysidine synthase TilS/MesJ
LKRDKVMSSLKVCTRCALPETFPGIRFNEAGVCNLCLEFKGMASEQARHAEYREKFEALIKEYKGTGTYDALMCYSGGKDSSYTLSVLKEKYGLNVLAVSIDNGFVSNQAFKNIRVVTENLGVDHIFFKPRFDTLAKIFVHCAKTDVYPAKALERASSICTSCMAVVKYSTLRIALEKNIPFIAYGWSPGQAPVTSSIIKNNPRIVKMMQKSLYDPMYQIAGSEISPYFLEERHFKDAYRFPYYVHPLAFLGYSEETVYKNIARFGWKPPDDTDPNSTNCLLNSFANVVHKKRLGFHPYALENANLVREGYLDRETALERLNQQENHEVVAMVREKLALPEDFIDG